MCASACARCSAARRSSASSTTSSDSISSARPRSTSDAGSTRRRRPRRARLEFGGVDRVKEEARDARGVRVLETIAARSALRDPRTARASGLRARRDRDAGARHRRERRDVRHRRPADVPVACRICAIPAASIASISRYSFRGERITTGSHRVPPLSRSRRVDHARRRAPRFRDVDLAIGTGQDAREMHVDVVSASFFDFFDARPVIGRFFDTREDSAPGRVPRSSCSAMPSGRLASVGDATCWDSSCRSARSTQRSSAWRRGVSSAATTRSPRRVHSRSRPTESREFPGYDEDYSWGWLHDDRSAKARGDGRHAAAADLTRLYALSWEKERALESRSARRSRSRNRTRLVAPLQELRGPGRRSQRADHSLDLRCRRDRAAHRVRQRRQPAAQSRLAAQTRDRRSARAGCHAQRG